MNYQEQLDKMDLKETVIARYQDGHLMAIVKEEKEIVEKVISLKRIKIEIAYIPGTNYLVLILGDTDISDLDNRVTATFNLQDEFVLGELKKIATSDATLYFVSAYDENIKSEKEVIKDDDTKDLLKVQIEIGCSALGI